MAGGRAKTAGRGRVGTKTQGYQASADIRRIQPLNDGKYARVFDPTNGKSRHLATSGEEIVSILAGLGPDWNDRIDRELAGLDERFPGQGWDDLRGRVSLAVAAGQSDEAPAES